MAASAEDAIYARLVAQLSHTRFYPGVLPQEVTLPATRFVRLSRNPVRAMQSNSGMQRPMFQFDTWGDTWTEARTEADLIYIALERWSGASGGVTVDYCAQESEIEGVMPEVDEFRITQTFEISHFEV